MFGIPADELLAPATYGSEHELPDSGSELVALFSRSARVDAEIVSLLRQQLDTARRLDRQLGAGGLLPQVRAQATQLESLMRHSVGAGARTELAALLAETSTLAGWQSLDQGAVTQAWTHYEIAKSASREAGCVALEAHATAEQAFVLLDADRVSDAEEQASRAKSIGGTHVPAQLRAWLAAAHGEIVAARGSCASLTLFDHAEQALSASAAQNALPYLALDGVHLQRWRGNALTNLGDQAAISDLRRSLSRMDSQFTRATTSLRIDLSMALLRHGEAAEAEKYAREAETASASLGSVRQRHRVARLLVSLAR